MAEPTHIKISHLSSLHGFHLSNIRDYASINQLICLSNMESLNSVLINKGLSQPERLKELNNVAIQQMAILENTVNRKLLK